MLICHTGFSPNSLIDMKQKTILLFRNFLRFRTTFNSNIITGEIQVIIRILEIKVNKLLSSQRFQKSNSVFQERHETVNTMSLLTRVVDKVLPGKVDR